MYLRFKVKMPEGIRSQFYLAQENVYSIEVVVVQV